MAPRWAPVSTEVDRATVGAYERRGLDWASRRRPVRRAHARSFAKRVPAGAVRIDVGCGAGRYTPDLGRPVIGLDAAAAMLRQCRTEVPGALLVRGDLEALPFGRGTVGAAWANMTYLHVPRVRLPLALADLHRVLTVGAPVDLQVLCGDYEGDALPQDDVGGRFFAAWRPGALIDIFVGAGFAVEACQVDEEVVRVRAERLRTLPDTVGPRMSLLVVGLNPSLYAADAGVGFARPGNRFWPAGLAAGLVSRDRDPVHALCHHGMGMTDLVKRSTSSAAELSPREYSHGLARVERLVQWLEPAAVCMVGLAGWRAAADPGASAGLQRRRFGGRPVYVMPSTSGANAHARFDELVEHLRAAADLAEVAGEADSGTGTHPVSVATRSTSA
jgi:double-stranded uracil-DNA glycosylase